MSTLEELFRLVDATRDEIVRFTQDLVRVPTVNHGVRPDTGNESAACDLIRERLAPEGIASQIYESAPGRGNLVARLEGTASGPRRRLLLMSHTDVVPVEDESLWEHPPFSGALDKGRVYGRGADDDKADVVAQAMALVTLRRAGAHLGGDLIYLAAADEESGGRWGAGWMADNHPDLIRSDWAINEGGGTPIHAPDKLVYPICSGEKGRLEARITLQGRSGHASRPWAADNPVARMAQAITRIVSYDPEIDVSHPFFRGVLASLGIEQLPNAENIDRIADSLTDRRALGVTLKAASRMTIVPSMLEAGVKSNSIPDRARLDCDVRTRPGQDERFVRQALETLLDGLGAEIEIDYTAVPNASPADAPFVRRCHEALELALGGQKVEVIPGLTVGFTDSRFTRPLGIQTYGFSPHAPTAEPIRSGVHGNNEFIEVDTLLLRTKTILALASLTLGPV
jgi:acetylornithine deacetylase/succinyl-diaminopimelate desuccinylase-like protein